MKDEVKQIIQAFSKSKAGYVKVTVGGETLEISKPVSTHNNKLSKVLSNTPPIKQADYEVTSKNVGRYHAPTVELEEGDHISKTTILGYIESMGLKHDIPFTVSGILSKISVSDGDVVEYGQLLFIIEQQED